MRSLFILVTGDPISATRERCGGFAPLIRQVLAPHWPGAVEELDVRGAVPMPALAACAGLVITGSASSVTERAPWILRVEDYLRRAVAAGVPTLGICFGHQLLGSALGGEVQRNPRGREIGSTRALLLESDPLFDAALDPFVVNMTHVDSVVRLPPGAQVLARTELEPHAAVLFAPAVWGTQFHPEFDHAVMCEYLTGRREILLSEGLDADALLSQASAGSAGSSVLVRFAQHCAGGLRN